MPRGDRERYSSKSQRISYVAQNGRAERGRTGLRWEWNEPTPPVDDGSYGAGDSAQGHSADDSPQG